jgi:hypothetical protein
MKRLRGFLQVIAGVHIYSFVYMYVCIRQCVAEHFEDFRSANTRCVHTRLSWCVCVCVCVCVCFCACAREQVCALAEEQRIAAHGPLNLHVYISFTHKHKHMHSYTQTEGEARTAHLHKLARYADVRLCVERRTATETETSAEYHCMHVPV